MTGETGGESPSSSDCHTVRTAPGTFVLHLEDERMIWCVSVLLDVKVKYWRNTGGAMPGDPVEEVGW